MNTPIIVTHFLRDVCVFFFFQVNVSKIGDITRELFQENLVHGKGLFARLVIVSWLKNRTPTVHFRARRC